MKIKILNPVTILLSFAAGVTLIVLSLIFTWNFWVTLSDGSLGIAFGIFGVINDFGKVILLPAIGLCMTMYFATKDKTYIAKSGFFISLWIVCFIISLISSQAFDLNKKTDIENQNRLANQKAITESTSYKAKVDSFGLNKQSISQIQAELDQLKATKEQKIKESSSIYQKRWDDANKKKWFDTPDMDGIAVGTKEIEKLMHRTEIATRKAIDAEIAQKEIDLREAKSNVNTLQKEISSATSSPSVAVTEASTGLISLGKWLSDTFGGSPDKLIGYFYITKNIFGEFLGLGLLMLGCLEIKKELSNVEEKQPEPVKLKSYSNPSTVKSYALKRKKPLGELKKIEINIKPPKEVQGIASDKLIKYTEALYSSLKDDNMVSGYQTTTKKVMVSDVDGDRPMRDGEGKKCSHILESLNIKESGKNKVIVTKQEAMEILSKA